MTEVMTEVTLITSIVMSDSGSDVKGESQVYREV